MNKNKYFITGGGTGGHIYPALSVAKELYKLDDTGIIYYVGNPKKLEAKLLKDLPYKFLPVNSSGMPRNISLDFILWAFQMFFAFLKCCFYILRYRPKVVFGTGGYVSAPILLASTVLRVPFVMHDCDANPGLVTRKLSRFANSVSVAFEAAKSKLNNSKCIVNGNPISSEFLNYTKSTAREHLGLQDKITLCVMGGSQGAQSINEAFVSIIKKLSKMYDLQIIFQTGEKNYEDIKFKLKGLYPEYEQDANIIFKPYFEDMKLYLIASDIAVSRAGSLSISELAAASVASIFIPYPYAAADHQRKNAKFLVEKEAGLYFEDDELVSEVLYDSIKELLANKGKLKRLQENIHQLARLDGTQRIVNQIKNCIK